jgi:hypothetical protein
VGDLPVACREQIVRALQVSAALFSLTKSDHTRFVHMICGDKSPARCAPPLTKGGILPAMAHTGLRMSCGST